jgi:hypothetical protein
MSRCQTDRPDLHKSNMTTAATRGNIRPLHDDRVDAVRYAVLQRIAPSIRHDIVANLQPIPMIYEVLEHRSGDGALDADVKTSATSMNRFAKAALTSCVTALSWLERDEGLMVPAGEAIGESVAMLGRSFVFMGFQLINQVGQPACMVPRDALRHTLTAALLAAIDGADGPSNVLLSSSTHQDRLTLTIRTQAAPAARMLQPYQEECRRLSWDDVQRVAINEQVDFRRDEEATMLQFTAAGDKWTRRASHVAH